MSWFPDLRYNAIDPLMASQHSAVEYWTQRDIMQKKFAAPQAVLWDLPIPRTIVRRQNADGSWTYPTRRAWQGVDYDQIETYRQLGFLIEMFGFTHEHPAIEKAAEYIFSKQTPEGDLRGIYAAQYTPNYTAALVELLVKAGYSQDERVAKIYDWLLESRQNDGGWALTIRTQGRNLDAIYDTDIIHQLDRTQPFSHLITGVVLRALAVHNKYRHSAGAKKAAMLLASRFFEKDKYPDKNRVDDWTRFSYPFWQTDIVSSLTSISLIDPAMSSDKIDLAKQWLINHQQPNGLFTGHLLKDRYHDLQLWYSLAICRIFKTMK